MGVFAALILAAWERALSWKMLRAVFEGTMRTTAMIMLIIIAAQFLNFVLATIGLTDGIGNLIEGLGLGKYGTMLLIVVFYLILGCFMETISMMILTTPFIFPIVTKLGWDPIWWGVVLTILIEAALVTPPVGLNLYVVQSLRERGPIADVDPRRAAVRDRHGGADRPAHGGSRRGALAAQPRHGQGMSATLGVDVGGTFTDFFLVDDATGETRTHKVASTPDDPSRAILEGLRALAPRDGLGVSRARHDGRDQRADPAARRQGRARHHQGLQGPARDRPPDQAQDLRPEGRSPRAAGAARAPLRGGRARRSGGRGHPPLGDADIAARRRRAGERRRERGRLLPVLVPQSRHEQRMGEALRAALPDIDVSLSCEVQPEFREYERLSTTVLNAFLQPVAGRYMTRLEAAVELHAAGAGIGICQSSGGLMSIARAAEMPIRTALSGPAAGVVGAVAAGRRAGRGDLITFDMGGTSTDVCLVRDGKAEMAFGRSVAGFPVRLPSIDIHTVGAGGGSVAHIGRDGLMRVGPMSTGADPGPACYGKGGLEPTVSDANLVLGRLPKQLIGGGMRLDPRAAEARRSRRWRRSSASPSSDGARDRRASSTPT